MGASLIGGCCGIGPEYIQSLDEMLRYQGLRKFEDNK
jgi:S-methylmethionine-dependent homocysteine/selenocysteine methylase